MKTIGIITDFGSEDNYEGIMKGVILNINPKVQLVDISHNIDPQNIFKAAFLLKTAYRYFPKGTIFLCVVDPGVGSERDVIILKTKDYCFLAPDNGLLSYVRGENDHYEIFTVTNSKYFLKPVSQTFHGRDIFAPIAAHISRGVSLKQLGKKKKSMAALPSLKCHMDQKKKKIRGCVVDVDHFGNLITNIHGKDLGKMKVPYKMKVKRNTIRGSVASYAQAKRGQLLFLIGSKGYLEISVNQGSAMKALKAFPGDAVTVLGK